MKTPTTRHQVFVVGLVGGVAAGKSQVARALQNLGAAIIDADALGHEVLQRPEVVTELSGLFGPTILNEEGTIQRSELGKLVFGASADTPHRLAQLEAVVHPLIRAEALKLLRRYQNSAHPPAAIVIDAPLLLEAGWAPMCDVILFIDTPVEVRLARALSRGWSEEHFVIRERAQLPLEEKRRAATHFISGTLDEPVLLRKLGNLLQEMR